MCDFVVHITGTCDGRVFEDRDVTFVMGCGSEAGIVPGVEMAVKKFRCREKSRLKVSAHYGYGSEGSLAYNIAPNAELTYEVEMRHFVRVSLSASTVIRIECNISKQCNLHSAADEVFVNESIAY